MCANSLDSLTLGAGGAAVTLGLSITDICLAVIFQNVLVRELEVT